MARSGTSLWDTAGSDFIWDIEKPTKLPKEGWGSTIVEMRKRGGETHGSCLLLFLKMFMLIRISSLP